VYNERRTRREQPGLPYPCGRKRTTPSTTSARTISTISHVIHDGRPRTGADFGAGAAVGVPHR